MLAEKLSLVGPVEQVAPGGCEVSVLGGSQGQTAGSPAQPGVIPELTLPEQKVGLELS